MPGTKHPHEPSAPPTAPSALPPQTPSPYIRMFERFRDDIDQHHERRERIIKSSREITALSKKMPYRKLFFMLTDGARGFARGALLRIFSLQRVPTIHAPLPPSIAAETRPRLTAITTLLAGLAPDLDSLHSARYARHISPGVQEYIEALALQHYLETHRLLGHEEAARRCVVVDAAGAGAGAGAGLDAEDFLLGVADLGGELMRFAITGMATGGALPRAPGGGDILADLRALRMGFEGLDFGSVGWKREAERKLVVMRTCVDKVEGAVCGMIVRGRERPQGWVPDLGEDGRAEERGEMGSN